MTVRVEQSLLTLNLSPTNFSLCAEGKNKVGLTMSNEKNLKKMFREEKIIISNSKLFGSSKILEADTISFIKLMLSVSRINKQLV